LSIAAAFELSYHDLTEGQQHLFGRLGLHPGTEIDAYAAAALDDCDIGTAKTALEGLYDNYLLIETAPGRYRFHDLVAEYAHKVAEQESPAARDAALSRLLDYYLRTANIADAQLSVPPRTAPHLDERSQPGLHVDIADRNDAMAWLEAERLNLHAAAKHALGSGSYGHATAIAACMREFLRSQGHWDQALAMHQAALDAAHQAGNQQAMARAFSDLADMQYLTDDYPLATASLQRALELYRALGDRTGEAGALVHLSTVQEATGEYEAATASLTRALDLHRGLGDKLGEAKAYTNLGTVQYLTGNHEAAAGTLARALTLYREQDDELGEADALTSLGTMQYLTKDFEAAAASQTRALELYTRLGSKLGEANALTDLATVQYLTGQRAAAATSLKRALLLYRDLGDRSGEAEALNNMGDLALPSAPSEARALHEQALAIAASIAAPREEARALEGVGLSDLAEGRQESGLRLLGEALDLYQRIGSPRARQLEEDLRRRS